MLYRKFYHRLSETVGELSLVPYYRRFPDQGQYTVEEDRPVSALPQIPQSGSINRLPFFRVIADHCQWVVGDRRRVIACSVLSQISRSGSIHRRGRPACFGSIINSSIRVDKSSGYCRSLSVSCRWPVGDFQTTFVFSQQIVCYFVRKEKPARSRKGFSESASKGQLSSQSAVPVCLWRCPNEPGQGVEREAQRRQQHQRHFIEGEQSNWPGLGKSFNPFTPKSGQFQNSPAASPEIWRHTVWRTWLFMAYSDERWLYYQFSQPHIYISLIRVGRMYFLNLGVRGLNISPWTFWCGWVFLQVAQYLSEPNYKRWVYISDIPHAKMFHKFFTIQPP